jgi:hypothetical protein
MSQNPIILTVTEKARKRALLFLVIFLVFGVIAFIITGILFNEGEEETGYILLAVGFVLIFVGIIGDLIILAISHEKRARRENYAYHAKNKMPKGAIIFVVILLVSFVIFIIIITTS